MKLKVLPPGSPEAKRRDKLLAIMRDGNPLVNPAGDMALVAGDRLLALGTRAQLERVEHVLAGRS